jgi:hypothetical protein
MPSLDPIVTHIEEQPTVTGRVETLLTDLVLFVRDACSDPDAAAVETALDLIYANIARLSVSVSANA